MGRQRRIHRAEVKDGKTTSLPEAEIIITQRRTTGGHTRLGASVVVDPTGSRLWILDTGASRSAGQTAVVRSWSRLTSTRNRVTKKIIFPATWLCQ